MGSVMAAVPAWAHGELLEGGDEGLAAALTGDEVDAEAGGLGVDGGARTDARDDGP
jgi:hypothetical protein